MRASSRIVLALAALALLAIYVVPLATIGTFRLVKHRGDAS